MPENTSNQTQPRLAGKLLCWAGAATAGAINALILAYWTGQMRADMVAAIVSYNVATTAVSCVIGYFFTSLIIADSRWRIGAGFGTVAGILVGAMNGTCVFPGAGTIVGAVIGAAAGLLCGLLMAAVAGSLSLGLREKK